MLTGTKSAVVLAVAVASVVFVEDMVQLLLIKVPDDESKEGRRLDAVLHTF